MQRLNAGISKIFQWPKILVLISLKNSQIRLFFIRYANSGFLCLFFRNLIKKPLYWVVGLSVTSDTLYKVVTSGYKQSDNGMSGSFSACRANILGYSLISSVRANERSRTCLCGLYAVILTVVLGRARHNPVANRATRRAKPFPIGYTLSCENISRLRVSIAKSS